MRAAEEAWGLRWRNAGQYATVVETLKANNTTRYGLVVVAYWRSVPEGGLDRQLVLRMTGPAAWNDELRRVANAARDSARF